VIADEFSRGIFFAGRCITISAMMEIIGNKEERDNEI